ncbi:MULTISPECIES: hypothetical protein [unclassified Nitrobacter]|uniref:hypothetical protein n=1 Tax=unclassified Nitrobacter TaxID=2620411 RepID=UPI00092C2D9A|nr:MULTISPECIES: hypothetical protein [unclassified Nitrobacter]MBN9146903.1 hypothetical protein [Nitrobacter sp.]OJU99844.1 MAG: hypothetical protein BGO16_14750 [Nitrobacter sp. 62-23]
MIKVRPIDSVQEWNDLQIKNGLDIRSFYALIPVISNWSAYAETQLTKKITAEIASLAVFGVGLAAVYILASALKGKYSDFAIAAIATVIFVAFYVLGQWVKRRIDPHRTVE